MALLTVFVSRGSVLLCLVVFSHVVMVCGLVMVVRCRGVASSGLMVVID
jgi:hypothetical protein